MKRNYVRGRVDIDVDEFCGWKPLLKLAETARRKGGSLSKGFVVTAFLTGGRVSEVLALKRDNFEIQDKLVVVRGMRVLKRWKKILDSGGPFVDSKGRCFRTERMRLHRSFAFRRDEPLIPILLRFLNGRSGLLFLSPHGGHLSRKWAYARVREAGEPFKDEFGLRNLYPHWFRAQRASQLASEYGFNLKELLDFFEWKNLETANRYAALGPYRLSLKMLAVPTPWSREGL